jgi:hypothetical protein
MANLKKSFNFRHGVQVDDDNFIVDTLGKVGIGSTVPTEILDVGGNVRVRGTVFAEVLNTTSLVNTGEDGTASFSQINVGVTSLTAGIITSSDPNGIVTYYGDARYLQGMPTSQWVDVDVGLGYTSIYAAGNVGIATTDPRFSLQIGDTASDGSLISGVGINSVGNIDLTGTLKVGTAITANSGVITATKFVGSGAELTSLDANQLTTGTIDTARIGNINISSGIITASEIKATTFTGDLVGIASTAKSLSSNARIVLDALTSNSSDLGVTTTTTLEANTLYAITSVGIGTSSVSADLHLRKDGAAEVQITSNDDRARLVIGRDITAFGNNFIIDTDNDDPNAYPEESGFNSVDIYNYAPGNLNFFIRPDTEINKKFNWINYSTSDTMMSLTQDGNLGIGTTSPNNDLHVVGTSTVTSNSFVGGNFDVKGSTKGTSVNLSGIFRTSSKLGIGLTVDDTDPSYDFQVGYSEERVGILTGAYITERGEGGFIGIVTAKKFSGIGSDLTDINPGNISNGTIGVSNFQINSTSGIITAKKFSGIGSDLTHINPANISNGTIGVTSFHINSTSGIITVKEFHGSFDGDGSKVTGIDPANISNGTIGVSNFHINSTSGIITASKFSGIGSDLTLINPQNIDNTKVFSDIKTGNVSIGFTEGLTGPAGQLRIATNFRGTETTSLVAAMEVDHSNVTFPISDPITGISTRVYRCSIVDDYGVNHSSMECHILAINTSTNYQSSKVMVLHNAKYGSSSSDVTVGIETYSNIVIGNQIANYSLVYSDSLNNLDLMATPEVGITGITTFKIYVTRLG